MHKHGLRVTIDRGVEIIIGKWWRRVIVGLTAAGLTLAACGGGDSAETTASSIAATTTTTAPITTTTTGVPAFSSDDALSVTDAYFEAYNAGDVEAVRGLFALDATVAGSADLEEFLRDWELISAWDWAQGVVSILGECVADQTDGAPITVRCEYTDHQYIAQAVGAPPVPWTMTISFDEDGKISTFRENLGQPDYNTVNTPFNAWMRANHPEDAGKVGCCGGDTVEESEAFGTLRSEYADKWVAYLDANGCTYQDQGC